MSDAGVAIVVQSAESDIKIPVRVALSSFIGTTIEWYDYFLYGTAAALVFPRVFFGNLTPSVATLASLATFAVAFILRPLGGAVFGHFGDRIGRKKLLLLSLFLMGGFTAAIGLIPSQAQIGLYAPVLLILCRVLQGFALGGEWGGAALMSVEHAPPGKRGLWGSTMQMGVPAGLLTSSGAFALVSLLPDQAFLDWGWRLPFLASVVLLVVGVYIRLNITEPAAFKKLEDSGEVLSAPIVDILRHEKRKTLIMVFFQSIANVGYFLVSVYALTYVVDVLHLPRSWATTGLLIAAAVDLVTQPIFGALSDRVGRKKVYAFGATFFALYAFPFFYLLDTGNQYLIWLAFTLGLGVGHASTGSLHGVIYAEQYPVRYRYSGSSIAYQLSGIVSSAPTPVIAAWLVNSTGSSQGVAWYIIAAALITLICILQIEETYRAPIDQ